ncbi:MAG TPA: DNA gyrase inhibitor YacG [Kiloniellaceae bacterium]|nr:DNA gyrase inhibitor YacG [Kiloniellaceae bacterium]
MTDDTGPGDARVVPLPRKDGARRRCPICSAPTLHRFRPFCSKRCADIDLGRWMKGNYRIPTEDGPGETLGDGAGESGDDGDQDS